MSAMESLKPPFTFYLSAAQGWVGLRNAREAREEILRIEGPQSENLQVLKVRWAICALEEDWPDALMIGRRILELYPESSFGWVHTAYALRRAPGGSLPAAWDCLHPAMDKFPRLAMIPYNLACYACQMDRVPQARELLKRAMMVGDKAHLKEMALNDEDLELLWAEIEVF